MATDGVNFLYISDRHRDIIHVFNYDGKHIRDLSHGLSTNDISMVYHKQGIIFKLFFSFFKCFLQ